MLKIRRKIANIILATSLLISSFSFMVFAQEVEVDNNLIDPSNNYNYYKGSVIIELLPSYLETLSIGNHTITALFKNDMSAEASFKVLTPTPPYIPPKTGIE